MRIALRTEAQHMLLPRPPQSCWIVALVLTLSQGKGGEPPLGFHFNRSTAVQGAPRALHRRRLPGCSTGGGFRSAPPAETPGVYHWRRLPGCSTGEGSQGAPSAKAPGCSTGGLQGAPSASWTRVRGIRITGAGTILLWMCLISSHQYFIRKILMYS